MAPTGSRCRASWWGLSGAIEPRALPMAVSPRAAALHGFDARLTFGDEPDRIAAASAHCCCDPAPASGPVQCRRAGTALTTMAAWRAIFRQRFGPQRHGDQPVRAVAPHSPAPSQSADARHASSMSRASPSRCSQSRAAIIVLGRAQKIQPAVGAAHGDGAAHRAPPAYRARRATSASTMPSSNRQQAPPAPAAPPDRQPQSAQRHQHQRADAARPAPASPRPAGPKPSGPSPASHRCPSPADAAAQPSSPNGISSTAQRRRRHHPEAHHRHGQQIAQHRVMGGAVEMKDARRAWWPGCPPGWSATMPWR